MILNMMDIDRLEEQLNFLQLKLMEDGYKNNPILKKQAKILNDNINSVLLGRKEKDLDVEDVFFQLEERWIEGEKTTELLNNISSVNQQIANILKLNGRKYE